MTRQPFHVGRPYRFRLIPGDYSIDLRGNRQHNVGRHRKGRGRSD